VTRTMPYALTDNASAPGKKRSRGWLPWLVGGGALLVAGLGYGIGWNHQRRSDVASPLPSSTASASASAVASAPKSVEPVESAVAGSNNPSVVGADASAVVASAPPSATASTNDKHVVTLPVATRAPWQAPRPRSPITTPTPATGAPDTRAPDSDKVGYLTLDTYPWTRVSTGGKVLGDTPLVRVPLSPGSHVLTMENTSEKVRTTTTVVVKAGETVSKRLAF